MKFLLDTNIFSELLKPKPNTNVVNWVNTTPVDILYISVLTIGEIRYGIEKLPESKRKEKIKVYLESDIPKWFENRILHIDLPIVERWGKLRKEMGRPIPSIDSLIASTALIHNLCVVTRNTEDFLFPCLEILNPWS